MSAAQVWTAVVTCLVLVPPAAVVVGRLVRWLAPFRLDAPSKYGELDEDQLAALVKREDRRAA